MKVFINLVKGLNMTRKTIKMVIFLYIINLLFSALLTVPMVHSLKSHIGPSDVGDHLEQSFDYLWWEEYRDQSQGLEKTFTPSIIGKGALLKNWESLILMKFLNYPPSLLVFGFLYILLHTFLAGGIVTTFSQDPTKFTFKKFFHGSGKFFPYFFGFMILSLAVFFLVLGSITRWFGSLIASSAENSVSEITPFILGAIFSLIFLVIFLFFHMIFDYARIKTVSEERKNILKSLFSSLNFVLKNPGTTWGLYYLLFIVTILLSTIYIFLHDLIPQVSLLGVGAAFILQQTFIFALIGIRCWLYASQLKLLQYLK
jgi:MFS family permease